MSDFKPFIAKVAAGQSLSFEEARQAFDIVMSGEATPAQIGGFLMALRVRGETVDEISGAVATMRAKMLPVEAPADAIDIVGTGGDVSGSYNISTCSAFVLAGAGVPVAKHGNRALSSKSGAADTLMALGIDIDIGPAEIATCIREAGVGFMFAPRHHSAMKHVGPARVELGTRTIFNLLGPLSNPAGVKRLMVGVFSPEWVEPVANVLKTLGAESAWVVHGDGLDEVTTAGSTKVARLRDGAIEIFTVTPEEAGLPRADFADLRGGDAAHNALALRSVLAGEKSPYRDIVLMNAAAGLLVSERAASLTEGVAIAARSIDDGKAEQALERLIRVSNRKADA
ncbi:anthranilate phosphoribosyltransferase [Aquibium carbonis]|uniref:Anthranilate phosphoribosyltransferase n=1 Tax=Aquibium carbonis TaxID=2495581 RepID=A0A3S0AV42_9HYPH|nr:anthranilate phosphoribosyltransferase [Aquibium carbonis]RST87842.1 anthranilate phosphoribosyltransferase [Aquibium carbonis]